MGNIVFSFCAGTYLGALTDPPDFPSETCWQSTPTAFETCHLRKLFHLGSIQAPVAEWQESVAQATAESRLPELHATS